MQDSYTNEQVERWCQMALDDGKLWGAMEERERIIKLLESNATGEYKQVMLTPKLIAEIRGEQK